MFMVSGLKGGYSDPADKEAKAKHYELIDELANQFEVQNYFSIICRELLELSKPEVDPVPEEREQKNIIKAVPARSF